MQQLLRRAPVILLLPQLKTLQQYEAGWHLLAEALADAPAEQLSVLGQSERLQTLWQVQLELPTPQPAALLRSSTLPDHLALLQQLPGRSEYTVAVWSAAASAALLHPAAEMQ